MIKAEILQEEDLLDGNCKGRCIVSLEIVVDSTNTKSLCITGLRYKHFCWTDVHKQKCGEIFVGPRTAKAVMWGSKTNNPRSRRSHEDVLGNTSRH